MKRFWFLAVIAFVGVLFPASSFGKESRKNTPPLMLKEEGNRYTSQGVINLYAITLGNTSMQDEKASIRNKAMQEALGPFATNAAHYAPNNDGTWRMWNFRPPKPEEFIEWFDYISNPKIQAFLETFDRTNIPRDFGKEGDIIYVRRRVLASELPSPLNRVSAEALAPVLSIFHYNEDGTMRLELRDPFWEENKARVVFRRLLEEINATK